MEALPQGSRVDRDDPVAGSVEIARYPEARAPRIGARPDHRNRACALEDAAETVWRISAVIDRSLGVHKGLFPTNRLRTGRFQPGRRDQNPWRAGCRQRGGFLREPPAGSNQWSFHPRLRCSPTRETSQEPMRPFRSTESLYGASARPFPGPLARRGGALVRSRHNRCPPPPGLDVPGT